MNLEKYQLPMGRLPKRVSESIALGVRDGEFGDAQDAFELHSSQAFSGGVCRAAGGNLLVTCVTDMPRIRPHMIDWWFGWHLPDSERYQLWHPRAHQSSSVLEDRTSLTNNRDKYIGIDAYVVEYIGAQLSRLRISFVHPANFGFPPLDPDEATAVCARVADVSRRIATGELVHFVKRTAAGSVMQSSFWLGENLAHENAIVGALLNPFLNTKRVRKFFLRDQLGLDLLTHCGEEMSHLATFLPQLYEDIH